MRRVGLLGLLLPVLLAAAPLQGFTEWSAAVRSGLSESAGLARAGDVATARARILKVYLDYYEVIEGWYGPGGAHAAPSFEKEVAAAESGFHALLRATTARDLEAGALELERAIARLSSAVVASGVSLTPSVRLELGAATTSQRVFTTPELTPWSAELSRAQAELGRGEFDAALQRVERIYLEGFEPLEARLPADLVNQIERTIHLQLRPALKERSAESAAGLVLLRAQLGQADAFLEQGGSFWFGAFNSFVIVVREGLEAVLLVGALLAYLSATQAATAVRRRIWVGAGAGIMASLLTWVIASTLLPMSGASREKLEGVTALVAVGVLLYVSHWLFQKTYIHDWKEYLRDSLGSAVGRGSALAMMGLAFAAVYREGFETVLFYQALVLDVGTRSVLTGFVPGVLLIAIIGWAIIRAGVKLPLKRVFAVTNSILLYLAFVFLGKGIFNLQESGAFAAHPIGWLPSHPALQQLFGFYPLVETVAAQLVLGAVLLAVLVFYKRRKALKPALNAQKAALAA